MAAETTTAVTGTQTQTLTSVSSPSFIQRLLEQWFQISASGHVTCSRKSIFLLSQLRTTVKRSPEPLINDAQLDARNPPPIPPYLSIFAASKISSACSCLSLPTPSTTVTSTVQQTSTATSTPPAVTSQVQTVTFVTVTTTAINTITEVQTLTKTISTTTTATTTTTVIVTETPTPPVAYCDQMTTPGPYSFLFGGPAYNEIYTGDYNLRNCCRICWDIEECVAFTFEGSEPDQVAFCSYSLSVTPTVSPIPNPPSYCPSGVEEEERLADQTFFAYTYSGPCDLAGVQYVNGG
ncbi:uncharacterized protein EAE98_001604 [Botrytis deweyae]|uniref:Apple domain-containing protein n=1 Tax=Botrytis deweyae TaxID=2478750 RepID=A0ABQ7IYB9_9HELO|nr:uncharacterized protein EAE98_001604 [Botrytis deweyae]KAF7937290.1 hypothetical protein EAE98_001604 [Botrytis deweyae]